MSRTLGELSEANPRAAYSIDAFCKAFGLGRTRTYQLISSGALEARKCGNRTLIPAAAAQRWLDSLPKLRGAA